MKSISGSECKLFVGLGLKKILIYEHFNHSLCILGHGKAVCDVTNSVQFLCLSVEPLSIYCLWGRFFSFAYLTPLALTISDITKRRALLLTNKTVFRISNLEQQLSLRNTYLCFYKLLVGWYFTMLNMFSYWCFKTFSKEEIKIIILSLVYHWFS